MSDLRCRNCGHDAVDHAGSEHIPIPGKLFTCGECRGCYPSHTPPTDHGSDRFDYVEVTAPAELVPVGEWWERLLVQPCADCNANVFAKWRGDDRFPSDREAWHLTIAHDDGCPRLAAEER